MTETFSKPRQRAEQAFGKVQSQFFARNAAVEEQDFVREARDAKTRRLREARLAHETEERNRAASALIRLRTRTT